MYSNLCKRADGEKWIGFISSLTAIMQIDEFQNKSESVPYLEFEKKVKEHLNVVLSDHKRTLLINTWGRTNAKGTVFLDISDLLKTQKFMQKLKMLDSLTLL